jgi:secreted trypsin-like serine protease
MKKLSILACVLLVLVLGSLPVTAITWGELDTTHTNVGAMVVDYEGYGLWQRCTGTLIHPRVFLTAGHCTDGIEDEEGILAVSVAFSENALDASAQLPVAEIVTHPDYGWGSPDPHDVAVLVLEEPVEDIPLANLPEEGLLDGLKKAGALRQGPDGVKFTVVGYGGTLSWPPPEIVYDDLRRWAESEYIALTRVWLHMSQNRLKDDAGTCFGDSGGPAFLEHEGEEYVVGITSWGDAQCIATGFDYRVDVPGTLTFIQGVIDGLGN